MSADGTYVLRLFVAGSTTHSRSAVRNLRDICETHLEGRYELQVVDIFERPDLAEEHHILATPTLTKVAPPPPLRLIGDLSATARVLAELDL